MATPAHSKQIVQAARVSLKPIGFVQKGSSRSFLSDEGLWSCIIEFQPHGSARGTFLNVGAHWLWTTHDYISFDLGAGPHGSPRIHEFESADNALTFEAVANDLAQQAATCALRLRESLANISQITERLKESEAERDRKPPCWNAYHLGIAYGLGKHTSSAVKKLQLVADQPTPYPWMAKRRSDAFLLIDLLTDGAGFASEIEGRILATRRRLKLKDSTLAEMLVAPEPQQR